MGGEGVVSVGQSCGSIRPSEKAKMEKGAKSPPSRYEKKRCWRREFQVHT
jgi:hypothetical protein